MTAPITGAAFLTTLIIFLNNFFLQPRILILLSWGLASSPPSSKEESSLISWAVWVSSTRDFPVSWDSAVIVWFWTSLRNSTVKEILFCLSSSIASRVSLANSFQYSEFCSSSYKFLLLSPSASLFSVSSSRSLRRSTPRLYPSGFPSRSSQ